MKQLYFIIFLVSTFAFAQPPEGYYNSATGTGFTLKTQLYTIISGSHQPQPFNTHWTFFETADVLPNGKVWDIYANCNFEFGTPDTGGNQDIGSGGNVECEFFNREHTFPTSWFGNIEPARSDVVQLLPVDKKVNSERGNLPYGEASSAFFTSSNGTIRGSSEITEVNGQVFEVIDEYKGDIARIFFYMATRYEDLVAGWENLNTDGDKMLDGSSNKVFEQWALDMLYSWHLNDPVSQKEIDRNNAIYNYQNNRNPFVDNPGYVFQIWQNVLSVNEFSLNSSITMFPNPAATNEINIISNREITAEIFDIFGKKVLARKINATHKTIDISNLTSGVYLVKLSNQSQSVTKKLIRQ
ncbi:T9SS type A sorting domain-containing protein [Paucihalobacter ruber]|uniref:T9SS type A sorting domain-containing protein n=1 Tax=Paucihalobacter ruber TaxID=2567861 RepID=A0A506PJQ6_9FLAO|nr:endonuclease [Paucihalobacter ruber]TPV33804.1 T9SS type A sorting domain-containing protein [Paucihalobacter ruber]